MNVNIFKVLFGREDKKAEHNPVNNSLLPIILTSNPETDKQFCANIEKILNFNKDYNYSQIVDIFMSLADDIKRLYDKYSEKCLSLEGINKYQIEDYYCKRNLEAANFIIMLHELKAPLDIMPQLESYSELKEAMQIVGLAHQMRNSPILSFEWTMVAYLYEAGRWNHRIGVRRARSLFLGLLKNDFKQRWPKGFKIEKHEYDFQNLIYYSDENYSIRSILNRYLRYNNLPDPETYNWRSLIDIANQVENKIASYARALGRNVNPLKAMLLLPPEIIVEQIKSVDPSIITWLDEVAISGSIKIIDLIEHIFGKKQKKESTRELSNIIIFLAYLGYGIEPDPRFSNVRSKLDDVCVIFNTRDLGEPRQAVSETYALANICASLIVRMQDISDEIFTEKQNKWLEKIRCFFALSEYEHRRLNAYFKCLSKRKITASQIKNALAVIPKSKNEIIASFIVSIACDIDSVEKNKISFLENVYNELKIDRNKLYRKLHEYAARNATPAIEPILIKKSNIDDSKKNSELSLMALKMKDEKTTINQAVVKEISIETDKVSSMLKNIFNNSLSDDAENYLIIEENANSKSSSFSGLDSSHENFIKSLFLKKSWDHREFEILARKFNLMPNGALEVINDWAFDRFGEAFAEDSDNIEINNTLVTQLKNN